MAAAQLGLSFPLFSTMVGVGPAPALTTIPKIWQSREQLKPIKAPSAARVQPNAVGRPYEILESHFGQFSIPPISMFVDPATAAATNWKQAGFFALDASATGFALPAAAGATDLSSGKVQQGPIGECILPIFHPHFQKGCSVILLPNSENSSAAINCFNSSYYNAFQQIVPNLASSTALKSNYTGYTTIMTGNMWTSAGAISILQIDNGCMVLQLNALGGWYCYGMKVDFLILNPPKQAMDRGIGSVLASLPSNNQAGCGPAIVPM
jgi:hypothetical protein